MIYSKLLPSDCGCAEIGQTFQMGLPGRKVFPGAWKMRLCKSGLFVTSMLWYKNKSEGWGVFYILAAVILCIFRKIHYPLFIKILNPPPTAVGTGLTEPVSSPCCLLLEQEGSHQV